MRTRQFAQEAREVSSRTFVAHVRYASTGAVSPENTHPFEQRDRLFAHNGVIGDPERIEPELGDAAGLVRGQTDSERFFALITREIERDGDVGGAIVAADDLDRRQPARVRAQRDPDHATDLWALRYPDVHDLFVLERAAGGPTGRATSTRERARLDAGPRGDLADRPAVVVASERMDEDPGGGRSGPASCCTSTRI